MWRGLRSGHHRMLEQGLGVCGNVHDLDSCVISCWSLPIEVLGWLQVTYHCGMETTHPTAFSQVSVRTSDTGYQCAHHPG